MNQEKTRKQYAALSVITMAVLIIAAVGIRNSYAPGSTNDDTETNDGLSVSDGAGETNDDTKINDGLSVSDGDGETNDDK